MALKSISTVSDLREYGINTLTGEACAYSMRTLCDLSERGRDIIRDYLGLPYNSEFNPNYNGYVGDYKAVASVMLSNDLLKNLAIFILFREGSRFVYGRHDSFGCTGYKQSDIDKNQYLKDFHDEIRKGERKDVYVLANPQQWEGNTQPSVGSRNIHVATGRVA